MMNFSQPLIMGIINVTPNSATSVGRYQDPQSALDYAGKLIDEGADILDLGAEATSPKLQLDLEPQLEIDRLLPVLELISKYLDIPISIDTSKPEVIKAVLAYNVKIINDVRALRVPSALETLINSEVLICLMHMSFPFGKPSTITHQAFEPNVMAEVKRFLLERIDYCVKNGIKRSRIIVDPGLGYGNFGKNTQDNLKLLQQLGSLKEFDLPILIGASRKTFIGDILNNPIEERLAGSIAAAVIAAYNGAAIIRTHDVKPTKEAIQIAMEIKNAK